MGKSRKPQGGRVTPKQVHNLPSRHLVFSFLCTQGASMIQGVFGYSSCVPSSRIAAEVLRHFGMDAECYPVKLQVVLQGAAYFVDGSGELTTKNGLPVGWDGHLIVVSRQPEGDEILDLSLEQANRPDKGIVLHPLWADLSPDFWSTGVSGHQVARAVVVYTRIQNNGWKQMPRTQDHQPLVQRIIQEIKQAAERMS